MRLVPGKTIVKTVLISALAAALLVLAGSQAVARKDMSCADLLKMNAQLDDKTKALAASDPASAGMDRKVNDYCARNPAAKASEAMEKAIQ